jgi:TonB family protein
MCWSVGVLWILGCGVAVSRDVASGRARDAVSQGDDDKESGRRRRQPEEEETDELEPGAVPTGPATPNTEVFHEHIRNNMGPFQTCFSSALIRTPGMTGTIEVQFRVSPTGSVRTVEVVRSSLGDRQLGQCITDAVRAMRFPAPENGNDVQVNHTFSYTSPLAPAPLRSTEEYRQYIITHTDGIRRCYGEALGRNPALSGQIDVRITVSPAGDVTLVETVRSTLGDAEADRCVLTAIQSLRFPRNADEATIVVTHSFAFTR